MAVSLDKIDSAPIASNKEFDPQFLQWLWVLVDTLNENIAAIVAGFAILEASSYTAVQIADMESAGELENGVILYDTTNDEYVGRQAGALVKFTTTPYP
jgi:hypothetical protein